MSANQISELIRCLQRMNVPSSGGSKTERNRRRRQRKRQGRQQLATPGTSGSARVVGGSAAPKRRRKRRAAGGLGSGDVVISRSEYLTALKTDSSGQASGSFLLDAMNFPWLNNLAKAFELIRWSSMSLEWRPAVGANTDGMIALGADWGEASPSSVQKRVFGEAEHYSVHATVDRKDVVACTPVLDTQVWQSGRFAVPAARLQSRESYIIPASTTTTVAVYDRAPCSVLYSATAAASKAVGELWVNYSVRLSGTRKV